MATSLCGIVATFLLVDILVFQTKGVNPEGLGVSTPQILGWESFGSQGVVEGSRNIIIAYFCTESMLFFTESMLESG